MSEFVDPLPSCRSPEEITKTIEEFRDPNSPLRQQLDKELREILTECHALLESDSGE
jgi:hypothetical protein